MNHLASESSEFFSFLILRRRSLNKACSCLFSRSSSVLAKRGKHNFWNISKISQTLKRLLQRLKRARHRHRINFTIPAIIVKIKKIEKPFLTVTFLFLMPGHWFLAFLLQIVSSFVSIQFWLSAPAMAPAANVLSHGTWAQKRLA